MFILLDIRATGLTSRAFAERLLDKEGVAVMPRDGFGRTEKGRLRLSLTRPDRILDEAGERVVRFAGSLPSGPALLYAAN
jgi:arginine:pyruvate transaminase